MELRKLIRKLINEELDKLKIEPNKSRSSGFGLDLVYLSISKSYACAYANGETSSAHKYRQPIKNGVLFYVCLDDTENHFGGDAWVSGYKDDFIDDLKQYKNEWNLENGHSEHRLDRLTKLFLNGCELEETPSLESVDMLLSYIEMDDLSLISPLEWSYIQEQYSGYSEICLKNISIDDIIKIEIYENSEIIKTINGKYKGITETIFYHGSPLIYWKHLL